MTGPDVTTAPKMTNRDRMRAAIEPVGAAFGKVGLTPNALTLIGFSIAALGGVFAGLQWWVAAGLISGAGAAFDLFDGALARATGQASKLGAFFDSTFDRWGEAILYVGIVAGCAFAGFDNGALLGALAMASAFMVSYTRSKSEGLGFSEGRGMAAIGIAPREVRTVITTVGLVATGLVGGITATSGSQGNLILGATLGLIAILATVTTIQRIIHVYQEAKQQENQ